MVIRMVAAIIFAAVIITFTIAGTLFYTGIEIKYDYFLENDIAIYGDSREGHDIHVQLLKNIMKDKEPPIAIINTGDVVNNPNMYSEWSEFADIAFIPISAGIPYYVALGNHDTNYKIAEQQLSNLGNYTIYILGVKFIFLDTNNMSDQQFSWLSNQMAEPGRKIVVMHHPIISVTYGINEELEHLIPLLSQADLVLTGHSHSYERNKINGTYYLSFGGGGAPLHDKRFEFKENEKFIKTYHYAYLNITESSFNIRVMDLNKNLLDNVTVEVNDAIRNT